VVAMNEHQLGSIIELRFLQVWQQHQLTRAVCVSWAAVHHK
jgi:hypothetical protein